MLRNKIFMCSLQVKNLLFCTFALNMYGSDLWCRFLQSSMNRIRVAYNNTYRILFNLPKDVSISSLMVLNNIPTFQSLIRKNMGNFLIRCFNCPNMLLQALVSSNDFY